MVLVGAAVADATARVPVPLPAVPPLILAPLAVAVAAVAGRAAWRALPRIDRTTLAGGAQLAGGAMTAAVMLDPSLLSGVVAERPLAPGPVASTVDTGFRAARPGYCSRPICAGSGAAGPICWSGPR